tara:strand:+ start:221 stop:559 length:339 start_codon:yes stop_codon:yes gene_type:complete
MLAGSTFATQTVAEDLNMYKVNQVTYCSDNGLAMKRVILRSYNEVPLLTASTIVPTIAGGDDNEEAVQIAGELSMVVNQSTGTYTVFVTYPWGTVCEILSGVNFEPYVGERQ